MKGYATLYTEGGGDPTFEQIDAFLQTHFNAKAVYIDNGHEHEWQPAGVTEAPQNSYVTYVWGMCKCGEIMLRQWDT